MKKTEHKIKRERDNSLEKYLSESPQRKSSIGIHIEYMSRAENADGGSNVTKTLNVFHLRTRLYLSPGRRSSPPFSITKA